jgi:long-chain acyl-CoA synthetase
MATAPKGAAAEPPNKPSANPAVLLNVPLFHATGLLAVLMISIVVGRKTVFMYKWEPEAALKLVEKEKITQFTGVPTMILEMLQHPNFSKYDTSSLEGVGGGGAPPPPQMVKDVGKKFKKASAGQGYGLSETSAFTTLIGGPAFVAKPTSCGRPVPGCTIEIWDLDSNQPLPEPESIGKVMIKGANVMKEYWRNPKATAEAITPTGYFDSGDIGKIDKDGYVYILDRAKQLLIRGGENIATAEVEAAVYNHDQVAECAVIGVDHPTLGEEVGVAIHPKPGGAPSITLESIRQACASLANFKKPTHVFIYHEPLPKGATGKILKRQIRIDVNKGSIPRPKL